MTKPETPPVVSQVDRVAAARLTYHGEWLDKQIRQGEADDHPHVQAFACHREAALRIVTAAGVGEPNNA